MLQNYWEDAHESSMVNKGIHLQLVYNTNGVHIVKATNGRRDKTGLEYWVGLKQPPTHTPLLLPFLMTLYLMASVVELVLYA